jgi:hypothetical protein
MSKHANDWPGAYHDGELSGERLRQVETHLEGCAACRAELEGLRRLSILLQEAPAAALVPAERFTAQVTSRLPRRPQQTTGQRALEMGWRLVPVGLLGAWAFVQAVFIVGGGLFSALQLGLGGELAGRLLPAAQGGQWLGATLSLSQPTLLDIGRIVIQLLSSGGPLGWAVTLNLALMILIGVLYWSWLASWWARQRRQLVVLNTTR